MHNLGQQHAPEQARSPRPRGRNFRARATLVAFALGAFAACMNGGSGQAVEILAPIDSTESGTATRIERCGVQRRLAFHRAGVQSLIVQPVLRAPTGPVALLIAVPSAPTVQQLGRRFFDHVAAAVDPPEVVVRFDGDHSSFTHTVESSGREPVEFLELASFATLESDRELAAWLDQQRAALDPESRQTLRNTLGRGWSVLAIRFELGNAASATVAARPLALRFRSDECVLPAASDSTAVPYRELWYLLDDAPCQLSGWPRDCIVRQLDGGTLCRNLTEPLPMRLTQPWDRGFDAGLAASRDSAAHSRQAWQRLSADVLAAHYGRLEDPLELRHRALEGISARLGLGGRPLEMLLHGARSSMLRGTARDILGELRDLHVSVADSAFAPEDWRRSTPGHLEHYERPAESGPNDYDCKWLGRSPHRAGRLFGGPLDDLYALESVGPRDRSRWTAGRITLAAVAAVLYAGVLAALIRWRGRRLRAVGALVVLPLHDARLDEAMQACVISEGAHAELLEIRSAAGGVEALAEFARGEEDLLWTGYALLAIDATSGSTADRVVGELSAHPFAEPLVRAWCAALRLRRLGDPTTEPLALDRALEILREHPAVAPEFGARLPMWVGDRVLDASLVTPILDWADGQPLERIEEALGELAPAVGAEALVHALTAAPSPRARRAASSWLERLAAGGGGPRIAEHLLLAVEFQRDATTLPWEGNFHLPELAWTRQHAHRFVRAMLSWALWAEHRGDTGSVRELDRVLRSPALQRALGFGAEARHARGIDQWLDCYTAVFGHGPRERLVAGVLPSTPDEPLPAIPEGR